MFFFACLSTRLDTNVLCHCASSLHARIMHSKVCTTAAN